jgi:hypothetical protein
MLIVSKRLSLKDYRPYTSMMALSATQISSFGRCAGRSISALRRAARQRPLNSAPPGLSCRRISDVRVFRRTVLIQTPCCFSGRDNVSAVGSPTSPIDRGTCGCSEDSSLLVAVHLFSGEAFERTLGCVQPIGPNLWGKSVLFLDALRMRMDPDLGESPGNTLQAIEDCQLLTQSLFVRMLLDCASREAVAYMAG